MRVIATYPYRHQGETAAGRLQDAGIPVAVLTGDAGDRRVGSAFANQTRIAVREDLADQAMEVLRAANLLGSAHDG